MTIDIDTFYHLSLDSKQLVEKPSQMTTKLRDIAHMRTQSRLNSAFRSELETCFKSRLLIQILES